MIKAFQKRLKMRSFFLLLKMRSQAINQGEKLRIACRETAVQLVALPCLRVTVSCTPPGPAPACRETAAEIKSTAAAAYSIRSVPFRGLPN
jgi:hypothetical protein